MWITKINGVPVSVCEFTVYVFCMCVCVVSRLGSEIPSYGGTHQERHLHAVRLERRSGVTRIVAPAELPRLGVPTLLIYRSRRVGVAARAARRPVGVLT